MRHLLLLAVLVSCARATTSWYRLDLHRNTTVPCQVNIGGVAQATSLAKGGYYKATSQCRKTGAQDYYVNCSTSTLHLCTDATCNTCTSSALNSCTAVNSYYATGECLVVAAAEPPPLPAAVAALGVYVEENRDFGASCSAASPVLYTEWYTAGGCPADGIVRDCRSGVSIEHQCTHVDEVTCSGCVGSSRQRSDLSRCNSLVSQGVSQSRSCSVSSSSSSPYGTVSYYGKLPNSNCPVANFPSQIDSYRPRTCRDLSALGLGYALSDCSGTPATFYARCPDVRCLVDQCAQSHAVSSAVCLESNSSAPVSFSLSCAARPYASVQPNGLTLRFLTEEHLTPVCTAPAAVLDWASRYFNAACHGTGTAGASLSNTCSSVSNLQTTTCTDDACSVGCAVSNTAADSQVCSGGSVVSCGPMGSTQMPTLAPTLTPTAAPSVSPTAAPSKLPSVSPTRQPTVTPGVPTKSPTSVAPSAAPTVPPGAPTTVPPTLAPTPASSGAGGSLVASLVGLAVASAVHLLLR